MPVEENHVPIIDFALTGPYRALQGLTGPYRALQGLLCCPGPAACTALILVSILNQSEKIEQKSLFSCFVNYLQLDVWAKHAVQDPADLLLGLVMLWHHPVPSGLYQVLEGPKGPDGLLLGSWCLVVSGGLVSCLLACSHGAQQGLCCNLTEFAILSD
jgi:hypothetical protein